MGAGSSPARRCLPSSYRGHPVSTLPRLPRLRSGSQGCWRGVSMFVCYTSLYGVCSCRTSGVDGCTCPSSPGYRIKSGKTLPSLVLPGVPGTTISAWSWGPHPNPLPRGEGVCGEARCSPAQPRLGPCRGVSCGRPWRGAGLRHYIQPARSRRGPRSESGKTSAGVGAGSSPA